SVWPYPFLAGNSIASVPTGGGTLYSFTVVYEDETGINTVSLGTDDVVVTGPTAVGAIGFSGFSTSGKQTTASYTFTPPGGTWNAIDNGAYTVSVVAGKVLDSDGAPHSLDPQTVATFKVTIVDSITVDNGGNASDGNLSAGQVTLREAMAASAFAAGGVDTIVFSGALSGTTITL